MKTRLHLSAPVALFLLIASLTPAFTEPVSPGGPAVNPATGLPATGGMPIADPRTGLPVTAPAPPIIDPTTGLPVTTPAPEWIDPAWPDPDLVLTNLAYENIPLSEVARDLRSRFRNYFDILPLPQPLPGGTDYSSHLIQLQLRNVKASDVFNAMNLVFENDRMPLRWQLMVKGNRPMVLLRVVPDLVAAAPESKRMIFYVGDLIGDQKSGGMTIQQIGQVIADVWAKAYGQVGVIQFYEPAQLVIVTGSPDQIGFVDQTIAALQRKVEQARRNQAKSSETNAKPMPAASGGASAR